jgi:hypothetical protein
LSLRVAIRAVAQEAQIRPIVFLTSTDPIGGGFAGRQRIPGASLGFLVDDSGQGGKWMQPLAPRTARVR